MVVVPGFEPGSPKATVLQTAELAILLNTTEVVAMAGFEPAISGLWAQRGRPLLYIASNW